MSDLEYVKMLEVPVSSSEVVFKPIKVKKKDVKKRLIEKVNGETEGANAVKVKGDKRLLKYLKVKKVKREKPPKQEPVVEIKNGGFDIVSMQVVTIFVLIVGIILTNVFFENSGMNRLLRSAFNNEEASISKEYTDFAALSPSKSGSVSYKDGVMTVLTGSVYSPCDGIVQSVVTLDDGGFVVTVSHSDSFSSVISGLESVYVGEGETVYSTIPVGYSVGESNVSMFNNDAILTSYVISDDRIEWI